MQRITVPYDRRVGQGMPRQTLPLNDSLMMALVSQPLTRNALALISSFCPPYALHDTWEKRNFLFWADEAIQEIDCTQPSCCGFPA